MEFALYAVITIFAVAFVLDFISTIQKAWKSASQPSVVIIEKAIETPKVVEVQTPVAKIATLEWIQPVEESEETEQVNVVAIAKAKMPQTQPQPQIKLEFTLKEQLQVMTVKRLRQLASAKKVKNYGNLNKNSLIAALVG